MLNYWYNKQGDLFFVDKNDYTVKYRTRVAGRIIRCLRVIEKFSTLLIGTDAAEVIAYDLKTDTKISSEHSSSPIYNILLRDENSFVTSERNGDIYDWEFIPDMGIFRVKKLFSAESTVFAMDFVDDKLYAANSIGKRFKYDFKRLRFLGDNICNFNIFCVREGPASLVYYGLSNGTILCENIDGEVSIMESHQHAVRDLTFSPRKKWLFSVSKDQTVRAWRDGVPRVITRVDDYLYQVIYSLPDASLYYVDGNGELGAVKFSSDIDSAKEIKITSQQKIGGD